MGQGQGRTSGPSEGGAWVSWGAFREGGAAHCRRFPLLLTFREAHKIFQLKVLGLPPAGEFKLLC